MSELSEPRDLQSFIERNGGWLITFLGVISSCLGGLCVYMIKSRCTDVNLCCGLISCERQPLEGDATQLPSRPGLSLFSPRFSVQQPVRPVSPQPTIRVDDVEVV